MCLDYLCIIMPVSGGSGRTVPLWNPSTRFYQTNTASIVFLLAHVPLFHAVDTNSHKIRLVLYHNTFFRDASAANLPPTAAGGSVHAKEFLYTTPPPYEYEVRSKTVLVDVIHQHNHSIHKLLLSSIRDVKFLRQSYVVEETYSKTKR